MTDEVRALVLLRPRTGRSRGRGGRRLARPGRRDQGLRRFRVRVRVPGGEHCAEGEREGGASTENGGAAKSGDVVAGLYVVDVADADEAAEWAKRIPTATYGKVEVRPIVEF